MGFAGTMGVLSIVMLVGGLRFVRRAGLAGIVGLWMMGVRNVGGLGARMEEILVGRRVLIRRNVRVIMILRIVRTVGLVVFVIKLLVGVDRIVVGVVTVRDVRDAVVVGRVIVEFVKIR